MKKTQLEIIFLSIKDLFTKEMLKITLVPFVVTLVVVYTLFFSVASVGLDNLSQATVHIQTQQSTIENGIVNTNSSDTTYTGSSILDFLLKYSITSWLVSFLVYTIGSFTMLWFSLFISLVIVGFFTPIILQILQKRYYPNIAIQGDGTVLSSIFMLIKTLFVMVLLLIVLSPLYFIPIVNIIVFNLPFYYFFHKMLHFDVSSTLLSKDQAKYIQFHNLTAFRLQSLFLYIISMIPFISLILPVFYIIYIGHNYFLSINYDFKADSLDQLRALK